MGYILKNTSGLINTKLTDTARKKISEGKFNISYFQIGDSEVSYNTLPNTYNQMDSNVLEPEFNSQNSTGVPQSNKQQVKYPFYVDSGSFNTYGIPFMSSVSDSVYNTAVMRGFFSGNVTSETISWSALTNNRYAINTNYVVDMSKIDCTDNIELVLSDCYTDSVRNPQAGDFITIYYDGKGLSDCSCVYPPPTPTPPVECWTTGFTVTQYDESGNTSTTQLVNTNYTINNKPVFTDYLNFVILYYNGFGWVGEITNGSIIEGPVGDSPIGEYTVNSVISTGSCGFMGFCLTTEISGQTFNFNVSDLFITNDSQSFYTVGFFTIGFSGDSWVLGTTSGEEFTLLASLSGVTSGETPIGVWNVVDESFDSFTTTNGTCDIVPFSCVCLSVSATSDNTTISYLGCDYQFNEETLLNSGDTTEICVIVNSSLIDVISLFFGLSIFSSGFINVISGDILFKIGCVETICSELTPTQTPIPSGNVCITPTPTPTPSATCCPTPTPSPQCPLPEPADCKVNIDSCYQILTYRITRVCGNLIYLDRKTPNLTQYSGCYGRVIIYPGDINEIYDSYTPRPHWRNNIIDFESVCGVDEFDVKIWNMNIPWSENPAGLDPSISKDYTTFGSINYLGTKEYLGYSSNSGQVFQLNPSTTAVTDTFYYNSLGDKIYIEPKDQKAIAVIHYTNNTIDFFYGEKFAFEPFDEENPLSTGQARNFRLHLPWLMWHKNPQCCNGETFWVDPEGFDGLNLFEVHYVQSLKNTDMNNPGIRYYHLWDTHPNLDGYPSRVGKVFPDHKIIVIDDDELIASMSYKSNRNWTLPSPRVSLITPNTCGLDNNSSVGILTGNNQTMFVTYKLSDSNTCTNNLHCNYYPFVDGPNVTCNPIPSQNVSVRFGSEFPCLNNITYSCWLSGFTFSINQPEEVSGPDFIVYITFINSGTVLNGKPVFIQEFFGSKIYWDGNNWVFYDWANDEVIVIGSESPLGTFSVNGITGTTFCSDYDYICLSACTEESCGELTFIKHSVSGETVWLSPFFEETELSIYYDEEPDLFVLLSGDTIGGVLSGLTSSDNPVGVFSTSSPFTSIVTTLGYCEGPNCDCISFTAETGDDTIRYLDCGYNLNIVDILSGETFSGCVINGQFEILSGNTTVDLCDNPCFVTTTTTQCPQNCLINDGHFANKFEIICQLVDDGGRPESNQWKIIDFTSQISGYTIDGYIPSSALTATTFVITPELYESSEFYDLNDYISLTPIGYTGYSLNFGDEYYFYGNIETDIEATIYEMRYKINLSQSEFQVSSNPSWSSGKPTYITEIGLYDDQKNLMVVSKLQSPVLRQGIQQFLVKFDF